MILVRTDASTHLGTGHAMRCLALTQALRDLGSSVTLASATLPETIVHRYRAEGATVAPLEVEPASGPDLAATMALVGALAPDWVVVDGYAFDDGYVDALAARIPLLLVDDWPRNVATPSFLLNQNPYASSDDYPRLPAERLLLGATHALLRREYATTPPPDRSTTSSASAPRILVTLGGADPDNVTARVVAALSAVPRGTLAEVRVVIGAAHPAANAVAAQIADAGFQPLRDVRDMLAEEDWADIAIGAAGTTSLELASRGLPTIHAVLMDNQVRVAAEMERRGVALSAGPADDGFETRLVAAIETLREGSRREAMSAAGLQLVDGRGARRVAERILGGQGT